MRFPFPRKVRSTSVHTSIYRLGFTGELRGLKSLLALKLAILALLLAFLGVLERSGGALGVLLVALETFF